MGGGRFLHPPIFAYQYISISIGYRNIVALRPNCSDCLLILADADGAGWDGFGVLDMLPTMLTCSPCKCLGGQMTAGS